MDKIVCVSASIDSKKRLWMPDHIYHHEAEENYLRKTVDNIVAEIRRKGAPFTFDLKCEKARSTPKASTSTG